MILRRRILLFYSITLSLSLVIVGYWSWFEFDEQKKIIVHGGVQAALQESPLQETFEILLFGGLPAILIGIIGGRLLMRRALRPIEDLTQVLEKTSPANLSERVPRSGNGDELDRMTAVFNDMKDRLGAAFLQAREFTLHASHELRTPLTILHGTMEQLMGDPATPPPVRDRLTLMLEEVQRLSGIVGNLAFLAKADAGLLSMAHEAVPLHDLVREAAEDTATLGAGEAIEVKLLECEPLRVNGDRNRLRQLLLNLVDNAVKYNVQGGRITLALRREQERACVEICNSGPVLGEELRSRVFERFFRGDAAHGSEVEGCGLGLSIAESIAHAHRGTLAMDATAEGLTRVSFRLPLAP